MNSYLTHLMRPLRPLKLAVQRLLAHDGVEIAGFMAYTGLVSLFPFVIFLFALAGFLGTQETAQQVLNASFDLLPTEVARTLSPVVREIFSDRTPGLLTFGIIGTIWVTSSGVDALRVGVLRGFELEENRPFWKRRLLGFAIVAMGAVGALAASAIVVVAPLVLNYLKTITPISELFLLLSTLLRLGLATGLLAGVMALSYRYLPPQPVAWHKVWPGAWFASILWVALASLFSFYLSQSGDYSRTYGSLGGVMITLLFLHVSAMLFLLGVEFSAVTAARRAAASKKVASPATGD